MMRFILKNDEVAHSREVLLLSLTATVDVVFAETVEFWDMVEIA